MGLIVDIGHRSAIVWAPHAEERWMPAPVAAPRLTSLPTAHVPKEVGRTRPEGQPSRMVAIAHVLAAWRAAERALASLPAADPGTWRAEAAVAAARADYHRLFVEHRTPATDGYAVAWAIGRTR